MGMGLVVGEKFIVDVWFSYWGMVIGVRGQLEEGFSLV